MKKLIPILVLLFGLASSLPCLAQITSNSPTQHRLAMTVQFVESSNTVTPAPAAPIGESPNSDHIPELQSIEGDFAEGLQSSSHAGEIEQLINEHALPAANFDALSDAQIQSVENFLDGMDGQVLNPAQQFAYDYYKAVYYLYQQ